MKRLLSVLMVCLPLVGMAQNVWERPKVDNRKTTAAVKVNPDQKYIDEGAVPEVEGKVVFSETIAVPGKTQAQIFGLMHSFMQSMTTEEGQFVGKSNVAIADSLKGLLAARYSEWLVFTDKALVLDRTQFNYQLVAQCNEGSATITINRLSYDYELDRGGSHYTAEEWITDQYGVNKSRTKLARLSGKFRRKTIDRKDYLFKTIKEFLTENQ